MNYDVKINGISPICRVENVFKPSLKGRVRTRDLSQYPSDSIELLSLSKWPDYDCISGNGEDVEFTIR